jgi:hypothetical protein
MNRHLAFFICLLLTVNLVNANPTRSSRTVITQQTSQSTLLPEYVIAALNQELSGETAKRNLDTSLVITGCAAHVDSALPPNTLLSNCARTD